MGWDYLVLEAFCLGEKRGKRPCKQKGSSLLCLENKHCPFFSYTSATEREVAEFVPFKYVLWDRLRGWFAGVWSWLEWHAWSRWSYDDSWIDKIPVSKDKTWPRELAKRKARFDAWYKKVKEDSD